MSILGFLGLILCAGVSATIGFFLGHSVATAEAELAKLESLITAARDNVAIQSNPIKLVGGVAHIDATVTARPPVPTGTAVTTPVAGTFTVESK